MVKNIESIVSLVMGIILLSLQVSCYNRKDIGGVFMPDFKLVSPFSPMGDQITAIEQLLDGIKAGKKEQVLLGGTGTGKTFTVSNVIAAAKKPTLVLAHNKTLAGQLYSELKEFFPENRVEYFISNFDFYQPEAYIPGRDLYIDKNAKTNYEIEMLRSAAMNSLIERDDVIVVASVASIYGLGNPQQYKEMIFSLRVDQDIDRRELLTYLVDRQYQRNDIEQTKGTFRVRGDVIEIVPGHSESYLIRIELFGDTVERISEVDPLTGHVFPIGSTGKSGSRDIIADLSRKDCRKLSWAENFRI